MAEQGDESLYPIAVLIDELRNEDVQLFALIALSEQGSQRCLCHQCTHITLLGNRCECCVYFLHGKRSTDMQAPASSASAQDKIVEDYLDIDQYNTFDTIKEKGYVGLPLKANTEDNGRKSSFMDTLLANVVRIYKLADEQQKFRDNYWKLDF